MCGIYGSLRFNGGSAPSAEQMARMGSAIVHRGPDDEGCFVGEGVALGMRRLSIIDLSSGHQPISNEDGTIWVVCNGEIYNFRELRQELEAKGHRFRCNSDTEVLVHLYEQEGERFLRRLRGMFGLAIWDGNKRHLLLARDRLGKKPVYIHNSPRGLQFASELKSMLRLPNVNRELDHQALAAYLSLGYVPAPRTLIKGIEKLLPGHYLVADAASAKVRVEKYWDVSFDKIERRSEAEWEEAVREKLLESVRIRLVSDVPLGAFLSGGLDSSSIVAAMAQCSDRPVKTYAIGFDGEDSYYNELPFANIVAKKYGTEHHEIIVRPDTAELLPKLVWHLDEPIADSAFITTYLVSRLARESVTVILSGVGGDELFGGYKRYLGGSLDRYYRWLPGPIRQHVLPSLLSRVGQDRHSGMLNLFRQAASFVNTAALPPAERYISYVSLFSKEALRELQLQQSEIPTELTLDSYFSRSGSADPLNQIIYTDIKTSLAEDLLLLTDKATMASSIECRAPFMDHELVELSARMPSDLKVRGFHLKYLLKKAVAPWLPPEIIHRKKRGFGAPIGSWLRRDLASLVEETLSEEQVRRRGLLNWSAVEQILAMHQAKRRDYTDHILGLITLELWCRTFLDGTGEQQTELPGRMEAAKA